MWNHAVSIKVVIISTFSLAGCLVVPLDYYKEYSRENVTEEPPMGIVSGTTTRVDVLLKLGEPDRASQDESEFWYVASKVKGGIIAGYNGSEIIIDYIHAISFDKNGVVATIRQLKTDSNEKSEFWSNEFGYRDFELSYKPEPHFSNPSIMLPGKKD